MNKSKIYLVIFLILLFFSEYGMYFNFSSLNLDFNSNDYARITDVDYQAVILDEEGFGGKLLVTERLTYDIHAASEDNPFWELWRDLPESYVDGLKVDYVVNYVKQINSDGTEVEYKESPKLYWDDDDYINSEAGFGPGKWYHSKGPYNEEDRQYECVLMYVDGLYRDKVTFEIQYLMNNAAFKYNDCSEMYLSLYSENSIKYLKSFKAQILVENKDMPDRGNYYAYTYGTNSHTFPYTESDTMNPGYHTFFIDLNEKDLKFKPYNKYIEFNLISYGGDKHSFTDYAPNNQYSKDDVLEEFEQEQKDYEMLPKEYNTKKSLVFLCCSAIGLIVAISTIKTDENMKKKNPYYKSDMPVQYFRDIPSDLDPSFAANLVFCRHKQHKKDEDGYSATMLSLVRKGYIELARIKDTKDWVNNNIKLIIKNVNTGVEGENSTTEVKEREKLTTVEEKYYNLINRYVKDNEITMKDFQAKIYKDYENTNSFVRGVESAILSTGVSLGYFQKPDYKEPANQLKSKAGFYVIAGVILLTIVNLISCQTRMDFALGGYTLLGIILLVSAIYTKFVANKYLLLTQFGEDEYVKWRGLYNFLNSETLMKERTVIELPLWEKYLVYATAFGISDKVIKAINIRCPDLNNSEMLRNPYYRSRSFYSSGHHFGSAAHAATSAASHGGYGGHGGGYGGGGRGGGGGRRRSLIIKKLKR